MRRSILVLVALLLLTGGALAQTVGRPGNVGYFGNEPNVPTPGTLPPVHHPSDNRVATYPADSNGMATALQGAPTEVLGAALYVDTVAAFLDHNLLLRDFTSADYLLPGLPYTFVAWRGNWADLNEDGWLTHTSFTNSTVYIDAGSGRDCGDQDLDLADEWGGIRGSGVAYRCRGGDLPEWEGRSNVPIVAYITPHVPTQIYPGNTILDEQGRDPDFVFEPATAAEGGRYYGPDSGFQVFFVDNSVLETTVTETISDPAVLTDGPRSRGPGSGSLVDVDLYRTVDPLLESVYQGIILAPITGMGCDVDHPERTFVFDWCPGPLWAAYNDTAELLAPVTDLLPSGTSDSAILGPTMARFLPPVDPRNTAFDYESEPHLFFDARLEFTYRRSTGVSANNPSAGQFSNTGSGEAQAPLHAAVFGWLGAWHDKDGDGFIGSPTAASGCPDAYDCGATADPHVYSNQAEFTPACRPGARNSAGEILAELSTSTGSWGPVGVYILSDRYDVLFNTLDPDNDEYEFSPDASYNPYDDIVADVLGLDGSGIGQADRLVTSGPVELHLVCGATFGIGRYYSYETLVFPTSNLGYDIYLTTESVEFAFVSAGIETPETVQILDDDAADPHIRAWGL